MAQKINKLASATETIYDGGRNSSPVCIFSRVLADKSHKILYYKSVLLYRIVLCTVVKIPPRCSVETCVLLFCEGAPVWPREVLEPVVVSAGLPLVLSCDPPPGPPKPETYWMSSCKSLLQLRLQMFETIGFNKESFE